MDLATLVSTTIVVTASGALSPGPLTVATISLGTRNGWKSGFMIAIGHSMIEFIYIMFLYYFINHVEILLRGVVGDLITIMGFSIIMFFVFSMIRDSIKALKSGIDNTVFQNMGKNPLIVNNPLIVGVLLTGLNIWFLIWWLSIGFGLLTIVVNMGLLAVLAMYFSHVWIDFAWLMILAEASKKGISFLGTKRYNLMMLVLGLILAIFGVNMLLRRFTPIAILP
ncbi:MAG: LysE family transporter [Desulfurococcaceae archaeon]